MSFESVVRDVAEQRYGDRVRKLRVDRVSWDGQQTTISASVLLAPADNDVAMVSITTTKIS